MIPLNELVFIIEGPHAGNAARINRNDGPIPGFPYRVIVYASQMITIWTNAESITQLPEGFIPGAEQGNIEV